MRNPWLICALLAACSDGKQGDDGEPPTGGEDPTNVSPTTPDPLRDVDGDGWVSIAAGGEDCDDLDAAVHPDAEDDWYDGVDSDCAGNCDYDRDGDGAVPLQAQELLADGDPCDTDPGPGAAAEVDCEDGDPTFTNVDITVSPSHGAVGVSVATPIEVHADPPWDLDIQLVRPDGFPMPTVGTEAGVHADYFLTPYADLGGEWPVLPNTTYTVAIEHACQYTVTTFTTGDPLGPVDPPAMVGRTWELAPRQYITGSPHIIGSAALFYGPAALVAVTGAGTDTLDLRIAAALGDGTQDLCVPTSEIVGADFAANPVVTTGVTDLPVRVVENGNPVADAAVVMEGVSLEITLAGDTLILPRVLGGVVDIRPVDGGAACGVSTRCVPCDDGVRACIDQGLLQFGGVSPLSAVQVVPRTADDIAADPSCP